MFPIVHCSISLEINKHIGSPDLENKIILGSIYPDLAVATGLERDYAHQMGNDLFKADFRKFSQDELNMLFPFFLGITSHGIEPHCIDYYSDEYWGSYGNGWCFMLGEKYKKEIKKACALPEDFALWKSHNFIEMACELITDKYNPNIKKQIITAINDEDLNAIDNVLEKFYKEIKVQKVTTETHRGEMLSFREVMKMTPEIFSINPLNSKTLAEKFGLQLERRHNITNYNVDHMARILDKITKEIEVNYLQWFNFVEYETEKRLKEFQNQFQEKVR